MSDIAIETHSDGMSCVVMIEEFWSWYQNLPEGKARKWRPGGRWMTVEELAAFYRRIKSSGPNGCMSERLSLPGDSTTPRQKRDRALQILKGAGLIANLRRGSHTWHATAFQEQG